MFWSGDQLSKNQNVIDPFFPDQIDCNSYTLRIGGS